MLPSVFKHKRNWHFWVFPNKQKYKINHHLNCPTTDPFSFRWNSYNEIDRKALRGEEHMQPELFEQLPLTIIIVFLTNCSITLIDKTDGSDPIRREEYWRNFLRTVAPFGLNTLNWWLLLHAFIHFSEAGV